MGKRFGGWLAGALLAAGAARGEDLPLRLPDPTGIIISSLGTRSLNPDREAAIGRPPTVKITGVQLFLRDTTLVSPDGYDYPLLRHDQNYLTFQYIGLGLTQPDKVRYRHRLAPFGGGRRHALERTRDGHQRHVHQYFAGHLPL